MPTFTPHSSSRVMRGADPSPPDAAVNAAARAGDVEKVIALVDAGSAIGAWTTSCAAASGSLVLLRELVDHRGCAMDEKSAVEAYENGHRDAARFCVERSAPSCGAATTALVARRGDLEELKWLRSRDVAWDAQVCAGATFNGHLDVLTWAREHGAEWDWRTVANAAMKGYTACFTYALDRDCPAPRGERREEMLRVVRRWAESESEDENDYKTILKLLESPEDPAVVDVQGLMGFIDELSEHAKEGDYLENCGRAQRVYKRLKELTSGKTGESARRRTRRRMRELRLNNPVDWNVRGP